MVSREESRSQILPLWGLILASGLSGPFCVELTGKNRGVPDKRFTVRAEKKRLVALAQYRLYVPTRGCGWAWTSILPGHVLGICMMWTWVCANVYVCVGRSKMLATWVIEYRESRPTEHRPTVAYVRQLPSLLPAFTQCCCVSRSPGPELSA